MGSVLALLHGTVPPLGTGIETLFPPRFSHLDLNSKPMAQATADIVDSPRYRTSATSLNIGCTR